MKDITSTTARCLDYAVESFTFKNNFETTSLCPEDPLILYKYCKAFHT